MHSRSGWFLEVVPPVPDSLGYANRGRPHTGPQSWTTGDAAFMEQILRHQMVMVRFARPKDALGRAQPASRRRQMQRAIPAAGLGGLALPNDLVRVSPLR